MNRRQISGENPEPVDLIKNHFNSTTPENVMKSERIQPREGEFNFEISDKFVEFGEKQGMHIIDQDLPESTFEFDTSNFQGVIFDERE